MWLLSLSVRFIPVGYVDNLLSSVLLYEFSVTNLPIMLCKDSFQFGAIMNRVSINILALFNEHIHLF